MHLLTRLPHRSFNRVRSLLSIQMSSSFSTLSSIQAGSYVTHPSLYENKSREELLARIAELERAQARILLSQSKKNNSPVSAAPAVVADGTVASTSSAAALDHLTSTTTTGATSVSSDKSSAQSKAERKLIKKQARLNTSTGELDANRQSSSSSSSGDAFFDRYGTRKIALRFCYEGWLYGGLALQNDEPPSGILPISTSSSSKSPSSNTGTKNITTKGTCSSGVSVNALPTVEGVLLDALVASRLIKESEKRDMEKLDFSRCGRTDRGVSAAGQVISLYVRSQLSDQEASYSKVPGWRNAINPPNTESIDLDNIEDPEERKKIELKRKKRKEELPYMSLLNRVLPNSIRILGWSAVDEDFDARFSCQYRHYKYFFTAPPPLPASIASTSLSASTKRPTLDIQRMQDAANRLVGEHDFRNLCKVDATKQITNFHRNVMSATISPIKQRQERSATEMNKQAEKKKEDEEMYVFDLKGSAFLYHQVRHIMAILFLVGSGKEEPSVIDALLNTGYPNERAAVDGKDQLKSKTGDKADLPMVSSKPQYEMASDLPLVLWDCQFKPESNLKWKQDELIEGKSPEESKCYQEMRFENTQIKIKEAISTHFMKAYLETGRSSSSSSSQSESNEKMMEEEEEDGMKQDKKKHMVEIHLGGGKVIRAGKYTPLLERGRSDLVEVVNERWAMGQGKRRAERRMKESDEMEEEWQSTI